MKSRLSSLPWLGLPILLASSACGDSGSDRGVDAAASDARVVLPTQPGDSSGGLIVELLGRSVADTLTREQDVTFMSEACITSLDGSAVIEAIVSVGPPGKQMQLAPAPGKPGCYAGAQRGYPSNITIDVDRGSDFLHNAVIRMPTYHAVDVLPSDLPLRATAEVLWEPFSEEDVSALVAVTRINSSDPTYQSPLLDDVGRVTIPESAFPGTGTFVINVIRATRVSLSGIDSSATLGTNVFILVVR